MKIQGKRIKVILRYRYLRPNRIPGPRSSFFYHTSVAESYGHNLKIDNSHPSLGFFPTASYLSDMLRSLTGLNAQQHTHQKLLERAKYKLSTSQLTVAEVAYQLGFEHPQSLSKFFKLKTKLSPLKFRRSST